MSSSYPMQRYREAYNPSWYSTEHHAPLPVRLRARGKRPSTQSKLSSEEEKGNQFIVGGRNCLLCAQCLGLMSPERTVATVRSVSCYNVVACSKVRKGSVVIPSFPHPLLYICLVFLTTSQTISPAPCHCQLMCAGNDTAGSYNACP